MKVYVRYEEVSNSMDIFLKPVDITTDAYQRYPMDVPGHVADTLCVPDFSRATGIDQDVLEDWDEWREINCEWRCKYVTDGPNYHIVRQWAPRLCEELKDKVNLSCFWLCITHIERA